MYYELKLTANVPYTQDTPGTLLLIDHIEGANDVDVTIIDRGNEQKTMPGRKAAFKLKTSFEAVKFLAPVDCTVAVFLTNKEVSLGFTDGAQVSVLGSVAITNDVGNPVPVDIGGGVVTVTADNVGINNNLSTITNFAPVSVGTDAVPLVADPTQKRLRIRNGHSSAIVAIGGPGVTLENGAVQLLPGDVWVEDDAPGAAWYAISDTAGTSVQIQGVK